MNCVAVVFVFAMQFGFPSMLLVRNHIHHTHGAQAHPGECRYWDDGKIRFHGIRNERDVVGDGRGGCGGKKWIRPRRGTEDDRFIKTFPVRSALPFLGSPMEVRGRFITTRTLFETLISAVFET
jgi:hypothetical protein